MIARNYNKKYYGADTWRMLPEDLLNEVGKAIVSRDPSLSKQTMEALKETNDHGGQHNFLFWHSEDWKDAEIGLACLAGCIADNPDGSLAEVVARYSEVRHIPFVDTAIAVITLMETDGLYYYIKRRYGLDRVKWIPPHLRKRN